MFALRVLLGFALVASTPDHFRAAPHCLTPESEPTSASPPAVATSWAVAPGIEPTSWELKSVVDELLAKGRYQEALDAYTRWVPRSRCAHGAIGGRDTRCHRIALCRAHLNDHAGAVGACLDAASKVNWLNGSAEFLVQLYREAGQLDDLGPLIDALERRVLVSKHPKPWLLPPEERAKFLLLNGTQMVRRHLKAARLDELKPWPDGVPKPELGSLPKTLPK